MSKNKIIGEGKTTNEAVEDGLKKLGVSKKDVDIEILEEDKKSFFSILAPRKVRVELTLRETVQAKKVIKEKKYEREIKPKIELTKEEIEKANNVITRFLDEFILKHKSDIKYTLRSEEDFVFIDITGEEASFLIGYRGETLKAFQLIVNSIVNKNKVTRVRIRIDVEGYNKKREKTLENLADKIAAGVVKNGKAFTLEPMSAYERKIIHNRLQINNKVTTYSVGEKPYRKIVVDLKK